MDELHLFLKNLKIRMAFEQPHQPRFRLKFSHIILLLTCVLFFYLVITMVWIGMAGASEPIYTASWYSVASCKREGSSGIMANGRRLNDENYTCAIWDYKFGTILKVINLKTGASVQVMVTDRGPAKRLVKKGRIIDLSKGAFAQIANLKQGIIPIKVEVIKLSKQ